VIATVPVGAKLTTVVIGAVQRSGGSSAAISPQEVKPTIIPTRKTVYWKSSGED
jgi:type IV pilus assembly protein PilY1